MIKLLELFPGVTLRCFPDSRFRQGFLSIQFIRELDRAENALNALLPAVLLRGCEGCPDLQAITRRLDELYGAAVGATVRRIGDYQTTGLSATFLDSRYALDGEDLLSAVLQFIGQLLTAPVLERGSFRRDYVESEKKNLICAIEATVNDKRLYAASRWEKQMFRKDRGGLPRLGEPEQIRAITSRKLYRHYQDLLATSRIDIFYVGSAEPERVAQLLRSVFSFAERDFAPLPPQTPFQSSGASEKTEKLSVAQGRLCMGFVTPITIRDKEFASMQVLNSIFGAGMVSKLFMVVREQLSLCYEIGSSYLGTKGVVCVSAGIDSNMEKPVREQVLTQLEACRQGQITDPELLSAKASIISSLRGTHDSGSSIEGYYAVSALNGLGMTPAEYMEAVSRVTKEDVAKAARTLELDTVYFLKGDA